MKKTIYIFRPGKGNWGLNGTPITTDDIYNINPGGDSTGGIQPGDNISLLNNDAGYLTENPGLKQVTDVDGLSLYTDFSQTSGVALNTIGSLGRESAFLYDDGDSSSRININKKSILLRNYSESLNKGSDISFEDGSLVFNTLSSFEGQGYIYQTRFPSLNENVIINFPTKSQGDYTLATLDDISADSLLEEVDTDAYVGKRLRPIDPSTNGFLVTATANTRNGFEVVNSNLGNGATASIVARGSEDLYSKTISMQWFGENYYVPYLRSKGAIQSTDDIIISPLNDKGIDFRTGIDLPSVTTKMKINGDGQIDLTVQPTSDNSTNLIIGWKEGKLTTLEKNSQGIGSTDLSYTPSSSQGIINSNTGEDAIIPLANQNNAGLVSYERYTYNNSQNLGSPTAESMYPALNSQGWILNDTGVEQEKLLQSININTLASGIINFAIGIIDQRGIFLERLNFSKTVTSGNNNIVFNQLLKKFEVVAIKLPIAANIIGSTYNINGKLMYTADGYSSELSSQQYDLNLQLNLQDAIRNPLVFETELEMVIERVTILENEGLITEAPNGTVYELTANDDGEIEAGGLSYSSVVHLGNSLALHPWSIDENSYWWGNWGMAASEKEKDYVHQFKSILEQNGGTVDNDVYTIVEWEWNYATWDKSQLIPMIDGKELVVIRLGENVSYAPDFKAEFKELLQYILDYNPNVKLLVGGLFWYNELKETAMREATLELGLPFVQLYQLNTTENQSYIGAMVYGEDGELHEITVSGVAEHPGDLGMQRIAETLFSGLGANMKKPLAYKEDVLLKENASEEPQPYTDNIIPYRTEDGSLKMTRVILTESNIFDNNMTSVVGMFSGTNLGVKFNVNALKNFLNSDTTQNLSGANATSNNQFVPLGQMNAAIATATSGSMINPMTTQYDLIIGGVGGTPTRLAPVGINQVLITPGFNAGAQWGKVGLTTHVTGVLPVASGGNGNGTGISSAQATVNSGKANLAGGNAFTGNQTINGNLQISEVLDTNNMRLGNDTGYLQWIGYIDKVANSRRFTFESDPNNNSGKNFGLYVGTQMVQNWLEDKTVIGKPVEVNGKLTISGDIEITEPTKGYILTAPNNSKWRITVSNTGVLTTTSV